MWEKIKSSLRMAGIKVSRIARGFKKDERGLSGVVVAILLILVAVLAVVIIWGFLSGYLEELWEQITANTVS